MAKIMIKDLKLNETVDTFFVVAGRQERTTKNKGEPFLSIQLRDASGELGSNLWNKHSEFFSLIQENVIIKVRGKLGEFNGKRQFDVEQVRPADQSEYDLGDFIRKTKKDISATLQKIKNILNTIQDADLKKLAELFLQDEKLLADFCQAPAAQKMHSACLGGLLEHTAAMLDMAVFLTGQYALNKDLLLLGVFLHDIGKLRELEYSKMTYGYTDAGQLLGHITIGIEMLQEKIRQIPDFPAQKKMLLEHLILSHHGVPEFGSPKLPMIKEAIVLHHIDNIDAKIVGFDEFVENNPTDTNWTVKSFMFENNKLFVGWQKDADA